ncbi:Na+/H+ antiporter subunit C [Thiofilum flexile]|uniref:Na+/H+ antiporter subunit C n=1 Tax=Thiofilum flexile TaxID=125627 RepID=UPI0003823A11|nr:Na+/H+ antiporter subunit C [Thiofilum flexile]
MSTELLIALSIGIMVSCGVYLILRPNTFPVVVGLTFLSYAVNVFLFAMGGLKVGMPPILDEKVTTYTDPLPQALVLTAIVISFGMTAFLIVLSLRARDNLNTDHIDGKIYLSNFTDNKLIEPTEGSSKDQPERVESTTTSQQDILK